MGRRFWGIVGVTAVVAALLGAAAPVAAHVPHDDVGGIAVSPGFATDRTALAVVRNRLMRTLDGGDSWQEIVQGVSGEKLLQPAVDPTDPQRMLLGANGGAVLLRSTDGGTSWAGGSAGVTLSSVAALAWSASTAGLVVAAGAPSGVLLSSDGGLTWGPVGSFGRVDALAIGPTGSILVGDRSGTVSESSDGGATWTPLLTAASATPITAIDAALNGTGVTILAATEAGELYRSDDGGATFAVAGAGLPAQEIRSVALSPDHAGDATAWLSLRESGAFTSVDGGVSWTQTGSGLTTSPQAAELGRADFGDLGVAANGATPVLFLGGFDGLFRSFDGAQSWSQEHTLVDYVVGIAVSPDFANDQTVLVTTYVKGAYVSTDGGATWSGAHVGLGHVRDEGNGFAAVRRLYNAEFSPDFANDTTMFTVTPNRFAISDDAGEFWNQIAVPTPTPPIRGPVIAVSPDFATDSSVFLGTISGEVHRSSAGGWSGWNLLSNVGSRIRSLVVSPAFSTDQTLFVGSQTGVSKSTDAGITWTPVGPTASSPQLAVSPDFATDGTVFAATSTGLHRSTDGGSSWAPVTSGPLTPTSSVEAVAVSPDFASDGVVLASDTHAGLLKSTDGGVTFAPAGADLLAANLVIADFDNPNEVPIAFSPDFANDQTVFAFAQQRVVKSTDGGASWQLLDLPPGTDFLAPPDIVPRDAGEIAEDGSGGTTASIAVDLSHPANGTVSVDWATVDGADPDGAAAASGDFVAASGTLTFAEGETRKYVDIEILDDAVAELDELVTVEFSNPVNAVLGGVGTVTIVDDEPLPSIKPFGVVVNPEGDTGTTVHQAVVTLSHPSSTPITIDYASLDSPNPAIAASGSDYVGPFNGTLTFAPGSTTATVPVEIIGDTVDEPPLLWGEWGLIGFTNPSANATLDTSFFGLALFIIIDDDP